MNTKSIRDESSESSLFRREFWQHVKPVLLGCSWSHTSWKPAPVIVSYASLSEPPESGEALKSPTSTVRRLVCAGPSINSSAWSSLTEGRNTSICVLMKRNFLLLPTTLTSTDSHARG